MLVPIISSASALCFGVLITAIFVYYCKVVKKTEKTEVKHENTEYDAWDYDYAGDNYVKDGNNYYDK